MSIIKQTNKDQRLTKVIFMGECMVELANVHVNDKKQKNYKQSFAGDTFNSAIYLKRTAKDNCQVHYMTCIGTDNISEQFIERLTNENIATDHIFTCKDKTLGLYMINTDKHGERSFNYWRSDSAAKQVINCWQQAGGIACLKEIDYFCFSGISLAILSSADRELFWPMLKALREQGCTIVFDPNYRASLWPNIDTAVENIAFAYQHSDIALPGLDEQNILFGDHNIETAIQRLTDWGVNEIVIKNGDEGCSVYLASDDLTAKPSNIPAYKVNNVVDTTSAGDSFNAAYLSQRIAGESISVSADFAAKIAAYVVQHQGAIINQSEFNHLLS